MSVGITDKVLEIFSFKLSSLASDWEPSRFSPGAEILPPPRHIARAQIGTGNILVFEVPSDLSDWNRMLHQKESHCSTWAGRLGTRSRPLLMYMADITNQS